MGEKRPTKDVFRPTELGGRHTGSMTVSSYHEAIRDAKYFLEATHHAGYLDIEPRQFFKKWRWQMGSKKAHEELARAALLERGAPFDLLRQRVQSIPAVQGRRRAVLICTGSLCPVHVIHLRVFDAAAKFLSECHAIDALVGFLSPSWDDCVNAKLRGDSIPFVHRFHMCTLACAEHNAVSSAFPVVAHP
jgi:hypothetical protein